MWDLLICDISFDYPQELGTSDYRIIKINIKTILVFIQVFLIVLRVTELKKSYNS